MKSLPLALCAWTTCLFGCDRSTKPDPSPVVSPDAVAMNHGTDTGQIDARSSDRADMSTDSGEFESMNVQGASMLLYPIYVQGAQVTPDYDCVGDLDYSEMLEVVACWHPSRGWLDPRHCVHEGYSGLEATDINDPVGEDSRQDLRVRLGAPVSACEREAMHDGFVKLETERVYSLLLLESKADVKTPSCHLIARESTAEQASWLVDRFESLRDSLHELVEKQDVIDECRGDVLDRSPEDMLGLLKKQLDREADVSDVKLSSILSFPRAKAGQIDAIRSVSLRTCEADFVWGRRDGSWELIGFNDSKQFSSKIPFGEGLIDVSTATCHDLDGNGSPELWISSGYETMGGTMLIDMYDYVPGTSRPLFTRYTGD